MTSSKLTLLLVAAISAVSTFANASPIPANTPLGSPDSVANPVAPVVGGATVDGGTAVGFVSTPPSFTGSETTSVIVGDPANPFGPNALTFIYQVSNDATSADTMERFSVSGFAGFQVDAGFVGTGVAPSFVTRSSGGDVLGFSVELTPGTTSTEMVVRTDAVFDTTVNLSVIDGAVAIAPSFGPAPGGGGGTPEPASLGIIGLGGLALLRRRSRQG